MENLYSIVHWSAPNVGQRDKKKREDHVNTTGNYFDNPEFCSW